jgi:hypothetical protein
MSSGNASSLSSTVTTLGTAMKNPVVAAALLLAGVFFNYYLSTHQTQENTTQIQQNVEDIKKLKEQMLSKDDFYRFEQQQSNQLNGLGAKIDGVNARIDFILEHESARVTRH